MVRTSMVECQWDSVLLSPSSPLLTDLELTFMGIIWSNSGLFSTPGFLVSHVGKRRRGEKKEGKEGKWNRNGKERRKKE